MGVKKGLLNVNSHSTYALFQRDALGRAITRGVHVGAGVHLRNNITVYPAVHIGDRNIVMDGSTGKNSESKQDYNSTVKSTFSNLTIGSDSIID